jgi:hypothetical protein
MSPFRTLRRQQERELNERRASEADIKHRHYVRPHGNRGLHVVKSAVDGKEYIVSGPGRTFQPGTVVPTGSNTGTQGETILNDPPPGRRGAGRFSPTTITKHNCPVCLRGRDYIAVTDLGSSDVVQAWSYRDGDLVALLDTATLPAALQTSGDERLHWELVTPTKIAFVAQDTSNKDRVAIWEFGQTVGLGTHSSFDFKGKLIYTLGALYYGNEVSGQEDRVRVHRMLPFDGEDEENLGLIRVSSPSTIDWDDIAVIGGTVRCWSDDLDEEPPAADTRWCEYGISVFGPILQDVGGNAFGGYYLNSGEAIVSHPRVTLVQLDLTERYLWPTGWSMGSGKLKMPLNSQSEYAMVDTFNGLFTRLPMKDYSGINTVNCPVPLLSIQPPPTGAASLKAFLPV